MQTLRLLFWLKWKLTLRGYQRSTAQWVGAVLMLLFFLPAAIIIGVLCYMGLGFHALRLESSETDLLFSIFLGIYLLWLFAPLLGYAFNDAYDITRLFIYPVSVRKIFLGVVCGSVLDLPTLFLLPTLLAAYFSSTKSLGGAILNLITVLLFLLHTFSLSQAAILVSAGVVRNRKFRDGLVLLISLAGVVYFAASLSASLSAGRGGSWFDLNAVFKSPAWQIVNYFPQGLAARALAAAGKGLLSDAFGYDVLLAAVTFGTLVIASRVVQYVHEQGSVIAPETARRAAKPERAAREGFSLFRRLPPPMRAMVEKEFCYLARDPYFRLLFSNFIYIILISVVLARTMQNFEPTGLRSPAFQGSSLMLLTELGIVCNVFGTEGGAITLLFLAPCARKQILLAKNLTHYLAISALNLGYAVLITALTGTWAMLPLALGWALISLLVFLALGNFTSIYAPYRLVLNGWRVRQQSASKGFGYTFLYLGIMLIATILLLPVFAALWVPQIWISPVWYALTIPFAVLYAGGLYSGSVYGASRLLVEREERIIAVVSLNAE